MAGAGLTVEDGIVLHGTVSFQLPRIAIARTPSASFTPLKFCRQQSERLGRDTADPKLHALEFDLDESCVRPVSLGVKIGVVGVLPELADLGSMLQQFGPTGQCDESVVRFVLK